MRNHPLTDRFVHSLKTVLGSPAALAFVPALCLSAFWIGGEQALVALALFLPLIVAGINAFTANPSLGVPAVCCQRTSSKQFWKRYLRMPA
ncbi:hypothetical protein [Ruegeria sp. HKCCSP335]|nr:hypothetical protein [Ruegeria sp. HKCCSP335]